MTMLTRFLTRLRKELFPFELPASDGELLFFRVFEALVCVWTLQHAWTWAPFIQRIKAVVLPLGIANYVDVSVLFAHGISYVFAGCLTLLLGLGFFRLTKFAYAGAILLFHVLYAARYSLGEISHGTNFLGYAVLALAIGTWAFRDSRSTLARFVFGFLFFFYGIGYTSAGVCKLIATGWTWPSGEHLALWVGERTVDVTSSTGSFKLNMLQQLALEHRWLGTLVLTFGLLAELVGARISFTCMSWVTSMAMTLIPYFPASSNT